MAGTPGRSGGRNKKASLTSGDGEPLSPRALSPRATVLYSWLIDKLRADDPASPWSRVDGVLVATLSELMEAQEHIASRLADTPGDIALTRVRIQLAGQISRMSALIGLCPLDRKRQPAAVPVKKKKDPFDSLMRRMAKG